MITEEVASRSPQLHALHSRLRLPESYKLSTLARSLTCVSKLGQYPNNKGLAAFGKNLITYHITEYLLIKYPRLPLSILNHAVNSSINDLQLAAVGFRHWGIEVDSSTVIDKYLSEELERLSIGKLRYDTKNVEIDSSLTQHKSSRGYLSKEEAAASAVKAIVAGFYASTKSLELTKQFLYDYVLVHRDLKAEKLFSFEQPTRELSVLCQREGMEAPVSRLLGESGRLTKAPVFLVGVFSGTNKLGESFGSSLKEAKTRASVNALKSWYLYSPLQHQFPSDKNYDSAQQNLIDHGVVIV